MTTIIITINDERPGWPRLKLIVDRNGNIQTKEATYDIAEAEFEPAVRNALHYAVEGIIKKHKQQGGS